MTLWERLRAEIEAEAPRPEQPASPVAPKQRAHRVVIYARGLPSQIQDQQEHCRATAEQRRWQIVALAVDHGDEETDAWASANTMVYEGRADQILVAASRIVPIPIVVDSVDARLKVTPRGTRTVMLPRLDPAVSGGQPTADAAATPDLAVRQTTPTTTRPAPVLPGVLHSEAPGRTRPQPVERGITRPTARRPQIIEETTGVAPAQRMTRIIKR